MITTVRNTTEYSMLNTRARVVICEVLFAHVEVINDKFVRASTILVGNSVNTGIYTINTNSSFPPGWYKVIMVSEPNPIRCITEYMGMN